MQLGSWDLAPGITQQRPAFFLPPCAPTSWDQMVQADPTSFWIKDFSEVLTPVWHLSPSSCPKNHLWQFLPCSPAKHTWGIAEKYSESSRSSWAVSCFPTLTYCSWPYVCPAPSPLFTIPLSLKYSTVSFSYWKENHNFKAGFGPHIHQTQQLPKLCGTTLLFVAQGWEEAIIWTACSVEGRHKITCCSAKD